MLLLSIDPDATTLPCFADTGQEHCLARVTLRCGRQRHTALLMSSKGRINTLEFKRSPRSLLAGAYEIRDVTFNIEERSVAQAINRLEHGRDNEEDA